MQHDAGEIVMDVTWRCALCIFVGDSSDPNPITIINGQLARGTASIPDRQE